jgi:endonuclease/exonuclease/phosphatase family metal-dependent hydrolase
VLFDVFDKQIVKTAERTPKLFRLLQDTNPDVICLQEVEPPFLKKLLSQKWAQETYGYCSASPTSLSTVTPFGQVVLSKHPIKSTVCLHSPDSIKRQMIADVAVEETGGSGGDSVSPGNPPRQYSVLVASLHLSSDHSKGKLVDKSGRRRAELDSVLHYCKQHERTAPNSCTVLVGDFNTPHDPDHDLQSLEFQDVWESLRPGEKGNTYDCEGNWLTKQLTIRGQSFRPDRILVGNLSTNRASSSLVIQPQDIALVQATFEDDSLPASDHHGLLTTLRIVDGGTTSSSTEPTHSLASSASLSSSAPPSPPPPGYQTDQATTAPAPPKQYPWLLRKSELAALTTGPKSETAGPKNETAGVKSETTGPKIETAVPEGETAVFPAGSKIETAAVAATQSEAASPLDDTTAVSAKPPAASSADDDAEWSGIYPLQLYIRCICLPPLNK